jgi:hypothetical protein
MSAHGIQKHDIANALASAIMRLGKNDWEGAFWNIDKSRRLLEQYRIQEQSAKMAEKLVCIVEEGVTVNNNDVTK